MTILSFRVDLTMNQIFKRTVGILFAAFSMNFCLSSGLVAAPQRLAPIQSEPIIQPAIKSNPLTAIAVDEAEVASSRHAAGVSLPPITSQRSSLPPVVQLAEKASVPPVIQATPKMTTPPPASAPVSKPAAAIDAPTANSVTPRQAALPNNFSIPSSGFSSAGVPFYPNQSAVPQPAQSGISSSAGFVSNSPINASTTTKAIAAAVPVRQDLESVVEPALPGNTIEATPFSAPQGNPLANGKQLLIPFDDNVNSSAPTPSKQPAVSESSWFNSPPAQYPAMANSSGCNTCGGAGCASCDAGNHGVGSNFGGVSCPNGCTSCGPGGCFDQNAIDANMGYFGAVSQARRYYSADALYLIRNDGRVVLSNFGSTGNYDGDLGFAGTIGERRDATQGYEISYFGTTDLEESVSRVDGLGRMRALFAVSNFFAANEASPFFNSVSQVERKSTNVQSVELNRTRWGWDVVKSFAGLRYIYAGDDYSLDSTNIVAETGNFNMSADNHLFGVHVGTELFYDVGYRMSLSGIGKAGVYANFNRFKGQTSKGGVRFIDNEDNNATISTSLELSLLGHYQINRRSRFRVGYQALHLGDVLTTSDNIPGVLTPFFGTNATDSDDMFLHGLVLGIEIFR